jgi:Na+-transporting NADH:ubiquinone oxidoreductase subunit NqrE
VTPARLPERQRFLVIRIAMAVGVATFIVVAGVLQGKGQLAAQPPATLSRLTTAMYVAVGVAAAIVMALRLRIESAAPAMRRALAVVAWAVGEFAALFGGVLFLLGGDWRLVLPGALVFAMSFAVVPIPE